MLHELVKEEPEQQRAPLETSEFNLTPFVNQSPAEKRLKFETARGRQLGIGKGPVRPMPNIAQVMGPGTASGVHSDRVALGRRQQMEKVQLQLIIDKLSKFTKHSGPGSLRTASSKPERSSMAKRSNHKKSHSVLAPETGTGREAGKLGMGGPADPWEEAEKTEEQKEMERFLQPIKYEVAEGQHVEIRNFEDIAQLIKLPELNGDVIRGLAKERGGQRDEQFDKLTLLIKPKVDYYKMGLGDRQLYLRRVEKLTYDITEEEQLRKRREQELKLEKARQQRDAGQQSIHTDSRAVGNKGLSPSSIR